MIRLNLLPLKETERALGRRQQRGAEVPVVVGAGSGSHGGKRTAWS